MTYFSHVTYYSHLPESSITLTWKTPYAPVVKHLRATEYNEF